MFSCVVRGNSTTIAKYKSPEMTRLTPRMARFCQQASCIFDSPLHDKEDGVKVSYLKLWVLRINLILCHLFAFAKPEDDLKLKVVLQKFEEYCALRKKAHYGCLGIQWKTPRRERQFWILCDRSEHFRQRLWLSRRGAYGSWCDLFPP